MGAHTVNGLKCKSIGFPRGHLTDVNGSRVKTSLITGFWPHVVYKNPRTSVLFPEDISTKIESCDGRDWFTKINRFGFGVGQRIGREKV